MELIVLFSYSMAGILGLIAAIIHLQVMFKSHDEVYFYFHDKKWLDIPVVVAKNYVQLVGRLFSFKKGKLVVILKSMLFSSVLSLLMLFVWRSVSTGSLLSGVNSFFSSMLVVVFVWTLSASIVGAFSILLTQYFVNKVASCHEIKAVLKYIVLDLFISYLLISISMYVCLLGTMSALSWYRGSFDEAKEIFFILIPFAHENALTWPTHGVVELDGLSASVISIATIVPSITFIFSILLALIFSVVLKYISPMVMIIVIWFTEQNKAKVTWHVTSLVLLAGAIAGIGKVFELIS